MENEIQSAIGSRYQLMKRLGKGSYGSVYQARDTETGNIVAIKQLKALLSDKIIAKHILREINILKTCSHPNIVSIHRIIIPKDKPAFDSLYLVMEYADTDLRKLFKSDVYLDHDQVLYIMYQTVCGVRYMHSANILHRDLKPANILVNANCSIKICDFGLSRSYRRLNQMFNAQVEIINQEGQEDYNNVDNTGVRRQLTGHVVTRWYRSPEVILLEKEYDTALDIWSLGCVFAELLMMTNDNIQDYIERAPLFPGSSCFPLSPDVNSQLTSSGYPCNPGDQLNMILEILGTPSEEDKQFVTDQNARGYLDSFPYKDKQDWKEMFPGSTQNELDVLEKLLQFNPSKRITLQQLIDHPYFSRVKNSEFEFLSNSQANFVFDEEEELGEEELRELFRQLVAEYEG